MLVLIDEGALWAVMPESSPLCSFSFHRHFWGRHQIFLSHSESRHKPHQIIQVKRFQQEDNFSEEINEPLSLIQPSLEEDRAGIQLSGFPAQYVSDLHSASNVSI